MILVLVGAGLLTGALLLARPSGWPGGTSASGRPATPGATPSGPTAQNSPTGPVDLNTRAKDPRPFTLAELFPNKQVTVRGRVYSFVGGDEATNCPDGATGTLTQALAQRGCSQLVRGTWQSADGKHLITVGLANLPAAADAKQVVAAAIDPAKGAFRPYPVPGTPAGSFDGSKPTAVGWQAQGHYAVFSAVGGPNGGAASVADPAVKTAGADLRGVVSTALLRRAVATNGPTGN